MTLLSLKKIYMIIKINSDLLNKLKRINYKEYFKYANRMYKLATCHLFSISFNSTAIHLHQQLLAITNSS